LERIFYSICRGKEKGKGHDFRGKKGGKGGEGLAGGVLRGEGEGKSPLRERIELLLRKYTISLRREERLQKKKSSVLSFGGKKGATSKSREGEKVMEGYFQEKGKGRAQQLLSQKEKGEGKCLEGKLILGKGGGSSRGERRIIKRGKGNNSFYGEWEGKKALTRRLSRGEEKRFGCPSKGKKGESKTSSPREGKGKLKLHRKGEGSR